MTTSKDYLAYVLDLLAEVDGITYRAMMGEYVLYCHGKVFGGIYDDRFLIKPTASAKALLPTADYQIPYESAKPLLAIDFKDKFRLAEVVEAMVQELPETKKRKKSAEGGA